MTEYLDFPKINFIRDLIRDTLVSKFRMLKTENERFEVALKTVIEHQITVLDTTCQQKNLDRSITLRNNGNESFLSCQYYTAVKQYTESIVCAPESSEELAIAYANRSAALFRLGKFTDCVEDIDRALNLKYPDRLKIKLYKRKKLSLVALGRSGRDTSFQETVNSLEKMDLQKDEKDEPKKELLQLSSVRLISKSPAYALQHLPPTILASNPTIPSASDGVTIKYSKKFGRHLVATRKIKPGEVLILEKPYCSRLNLKNVYTHCSYCLQVSWTMIPCQYCINVAYCSEKCKNKAWDDYHEVECSVVGLLLGHGFNNILWLSLRMAITATEKGTKLDALKQELKTIDDSTDPCTKGYGDDGKFYSDKYRSIYSLTDNIDKCSAVNLIVRPLWTAITVCTLATESRMFGKKLSLHTLAKNQDVIFVGKLILKNIHTLFSNRQSYGPSHGPEGQSLGDAVMAVSNLINHSCDANTIKQWYADCMAVYAVYPIEQGEQVFDNYGPRFNVMEKCIRQRYLNRWHFNCDCLPCANNWPTMHSLPSYRKQKMSEDSKKQLDQIIYRYKVCNLMFDDNIRYLPNILNELLKMINLLFENVQKPCIELMMAISMLKEYYEWSDVIFHYEPIDKF
ncbi:SET and MYND domain-containing protein 4-like isoform X1 [Neodiprion pinetum]|uniref:SET and MYND domain-containing protein 4-like isoform X1 n=2 Tax=Neodiprion pinetum TaxID=441929 RepID=UPI001EDE5295|nr:SET and MYND domain-containing protein 4-like isoform X1 [Neodiprion pinetum]XP_046483626.1 SET and MYND domain-containing protein 4-like isoform X1 [Neodiprion pinetum]